MFSDLCKTLQKYFILFSMQINFHFLLQIKNVFKKHIKYDIIHLPDKQVQLSTKFSDERGRCKIDE